MIETSVRERRAVAVRGIVQGVGFRPFIYALARQHQLAGLVRNDAQGVHVEVEGQPRNLEKFLAGIREEAPPLAVVEAITWQPIETRGDSDFRIEQSQTGMQRHALISPDVTLCRECLAELFEPGNRRYRYPFINCTNCGPRFTITRAVPYDRPTTTMAGFAMCAPCRQEYDDPANRRFHAQPNACATCGPRVALLDRYGTDVSEQTGDAIAQAATLLRDGAILAVKGLGGYHLACDPFSQGAVRALRTRKARQDKPFAIMARDLDQIRTLCCTTPEEESLLTSPARPIVLLQRLGDSKDVPRLSPDVAPRQSAIGVMLAYTPLHHLLLHDSGTPLVMTSANRSDEPIAYRDEDVFAHLGGIADYFLIHDRPIHLRCDDSVARVIDRQPSLIRRARGYAPAPLTVTPRCGVHTLACGGELKSTFCLGKDQHAFISQHIGDLENYETLSSYRDGIEHYCRLFDINPKLVAYDLHPEYLSTKYAHELEETGMAAIGIQHHHAHVVSCLADNQRPPEEGVIGVALDGTGYGTDGAIWGGEFFEGSIHLGFTRRAHLNGVHMPGGTAAIREPWRMAVAHLLALYGEEAVLGLPLAVVQRSGERNVHLMAQLIRSELNAPLTSSAGRLFDAVGALLDVPGSQHISYEGQAAIELEMAARGQTSRAYPFALRETSLGWVVETGEIIAGVVRDLQQGHGAEEIAARFHSTMAEVVVEGCRHIRRAGGVGSVVLSGGTFQNMLLLNQVIDRLRAENFRVYFHRRVPTNDGGVSFGQLVLANNMFRQTNG